jgi:starvation-inducible outer membrane lipoprotein
MKYLLIAFLGLAACKAHPHHYEVKLQDGTSGYRLDCDRTEFTDQQCVEEAARVCGGAVTIMDDANNGRNTIVRCIKQ